MSGITVLYISVRVAAERKEMLELKQLQFFKACVEEGSFSRAAEVLYTSQPNISKVIRELEQELGLKLFERGGRGITPTTEGKTLYRYASEMLQREETIANLAKSRRHNILRISTNQSRSMARAITDYRDQRQEPLDMQILEGSTDAVLKDVEQYRSDLGFAFIMDVQMPSFQYNLQRRSMSCEVLHQARACVSMGEKNRYCRNRIIKFREMRDQNYVRASDEFFSLENGLCTIESSLKPALDRAMISNSSHVILNLLADTDLCNICVPTFYSEKPAEGVRIAMIEPAIWVDFVCIFREEPSGESGRFLKYLRQRETKEPGMGEKN